MEKKIRITGNPCAIFLTIASSIVALIPLTKSKYVNNLRASPPEYFNNKSVCFRLIFRSIKMIIFLYVVISVITLAAIMYDRVFGKNTHVDNSIANNSITEDCSVNKCICTGYGGKICSNKCDLIKSYLDGNTEYQDFVKNQKKDGGPYWKTISHGSY